MRQATGARAEMGEVHARLDRLSQQLERLARPERPRSEPIRPETPRYEPRLTGAPPAPHRDRTM
ncbi:MAG: hypothetical protein WBQ55_19675, partial [Xanthobacteraceae bacterium]